MKLSWFNTSMDTHKLCLANEKVQYKAMQDKREIELRDSGSNTNNKIYFEIRATPLRPCLYTEGFPLRPYMTSHKREPPPRNLQLQTSNILKIHLEGRVNRCIS